MTKLTLKLPAAWVATLAVIAAVLSDVRIPSATGREIVALTLAVLTALGVGHTAAIGARITGAVPVPAPVLPAVWVAAIGALSAALASLGPFLPAPWSYLATAVIAAVGVLLGGSVASGQIADAHALALTARKETSR